MKATRFDRSKSVTDPRTRTDEADRGQAYTLEGFIASIVVLTAVLLALQAVVITPTTGGSVDRTVQAQLQEEASDALHVAENDGDLTRTLLYWDHDNESYYDANVPEAQPGHYTHGQFSNVSQLGAILEGRFKDSGRSYNVEVIYRNGTAETERYYLVYEGSPTANAFAASHTVTLTDEQRLTAPGSRNVTVAEARDKHGYPMPNVDEFEDDSELYNVVEVRIVVW